MKSIWDKEITVHCTMAEKMNFILLEISKDLGITKEEAIVRAIEGSPLYLEKEKQLTDADFFQGSENV